MEFANFGWNALTISFVGIIFFSLLGTWGLYHQNKKIWNNRSGESVSVKWFIMYVFLYIAFLIYGMGQNSAALMFHGIVRIIFNVPILIGLYCFKGFTKTEWSIFFFLAVCTFVMAIFPRSGLLFLLFAYGGATAAATQPWEIWRTKSSGKVSIKLVIIYMVSSLFWGIYSFAFDDLVMKIVFISYFTVYAITARLWFKYRKQLNHCDLPIDSS